MRDRYGEFLEAPLPVGNLGTEQVLMVAVERLPLQVFVGAIADGHGGAGQHIFHPTVKPQLFQLCCMQRVLNCGQDGADARPVGFGIALR